LLGLAIAIILALVAALVGPLLIDWNGYRSVFEAEASHLLGEQVHVTGAIDARLLPSPRLTLHDIEVGQDAGQGTAQDTGKNTGKNGAGAIRARSLAIEFALAPLMRGQWRATELHIAGPTIGLTIDAAGHVKAPNIAVGFSPDALTIERLGIEDGRVTVTDAASGGVTVFDKLWFNGDARSLIGPFKGEGAVTIAGELYPFRLATGRYSDAGAIKLHLNVDPVSRPLSIEADGDLTLTGDDPKFEGTLSLAKPVGIASGGAARLTQPWKLSGTLKADAKSALMDKVDFQYGSVDRGLKLTGVADFKFGKNPRFEGVLSGRQIDLDRVLVAADGSQPPPAAAIRELVELSGAAFRPSIPISIGVGIDQVTLGGSSVQNLRGDITSDAGGWNLDRFEFRAPGFTQVRLSGHLAVDADGVAFTGPAEIDANDPNSLAAWLEGRGVDASKTAHAAALPEAGPLSLRGDVTLGGEKVAIDKLTARFDRKTVSGRMAYFFAAGDRPAKFDAALNAPELDLDAALGFGRALMAGSTVERPRDMTIAADIGRATVGGFVAHNASARLKIDAGGLQIDKLAVADLGGAAFSASGRIVTTAPSPQGSINVDLTAPDMAPVMALLSRFAPATVKALGQDATAMAPAKLHARLTIDGAAPGLAKLGVDGSLGKVNLTLNAQGNAGSFPPSAGNLRLDAKLTADDGKMLTAMLGIDRALAVETGPAALSVDLHGPADGALQVDARLIAKGLDVKADGTAQPFADKPTASLRASIASGNAAPLRGPGGAAAALPVTFDGRIAVSGDDLTITDIEAAVGGSGLRGKLAATLSTPHKLTGDIEADTVDGVGLIAAAIGMPDVATNATAAAAPGVGKTLPEKKTLPDKRALPDKKTLTDKKTSGDNSRGDKDRPDNNWVWSGEPFGDGAFGNFTGSVGLKARRLELSPQLTAREFHTTLHFAPREIDIDDIAGVLAGGRFSGRVAYKDADAGLTARAKLVLTGADAAVLLRSGPRPAATGTLDLSAEVEGTGLSPLALIGSLQGSGKVALSHAQLAGLDPRAFDAVTRAVDQGLSVDSGRIADIVQKALTSGQLSVSRAEGPFTISAGQLRLSQAAIESKDADLAINGTIDLTDGSIDAHMVLSGSSEAAGARPDIFMALKGPVFAPSRSVDVSALSGWLTLRAVENQAKKLHEIEKQRALDAGRAKPQPPPQTAPPQDQPKTTPPATAAPKPKPGSAPISAPQPSGAPQQLRSTGVNQKAEPILSTEPKIRLAPKLPAPVDIGRLPQPPAATGQQSGSLRP
jgi:large subunit ribosomal protein L24